MTKNDLIAAMVENGMSKQDAVHALVVRAKIAEEQITARPRVMRKAPDGDFSFISLKQSPSF